MNPTAPRSVTGRADGWIVGPPRRDPPSLRLFCLPYVAGAASVYAPWRGALGEHTEVCAIELPGRQTRWRTPAYTRLGPLVDALASALRNELDVPWALFGHSMGALIAFELARELRRRGAGEPRVLFVSAGPAPRLRGGSPRVHDLPAARIAARIAALGGLPEELRAEPELLRLFLPVIRADFAVCETYRYRPERPLDCPVVAFAGRDDAEVPPERMAPWAEETAGRFTRHVLPGGHFFLRTAQAELLRAVHGALGAPGAPGRPGRPGAPGAP
ncbi:thioesterase II family protein [Streptomyces aidingensis]|uniref:Surfactin synthase thioesterase subunit n=1 Tax=Streptomyces aidingensis TaxID=910347 RepID=A0A1I1T7P5_9ACTN|nr:alpha/beta fold hydrolase [Streptomyces aidingensis]SFD53148.1 Surfactin synthase thioesterase subunit [Streptomyces aidingensis]